MKKQRKHYKPEEKVAVLRRHLLEKELSYGGQLMALPHGIHRRA